MKKLIAGGAAALLLAGGLAAASAVPASAHTPSYSVDCTGIELTLTGYIDAMPGTPDTEETIPNPDYTPATDPVYTTEYEFVHKNPNHPNSPRWQSDPNWNADNNDNSKGWSATGETRQTLVTEGTPAIGEPEITVVVPGTPERTNAVKVTIDGETVEDATFDRTFEASYAFADETVAHDYTIEVVAWDDPAFNLSVSGISEPCIPEVPTYQPTCDVVAGSAVLTGDGVLTVAGDWATDTIDVPFTGTLADIGSVLNIDADPIGFVGLHIDTAEGTIVFEEEASYAGKLWSNSAWEGVDPGMGYAAFGTIGEFIHLNGDVAVTGVRLLYTHPEASTTTVSSFTIGCTLYTFEPEDTEEPPIEEPPVEEPPVEEPPVEKPEEPKQEKPTVKPVADVLPRTGSNSDGALWAGMSILLLGASLLGASAIRRRTNQQ